jgi:hypothetical protein
LACEPQLNRKKHFVCALHCAARGPSAERKDFFVGFFPALSLQRALRASDTYRAIFIRPADAGLDYEKSNKFHPTFLGMKPAAGWHSLIKDS